MAAARAQPGRLQPGWSPVGLRHRTGHSRLECRHGNSTQNRRLPAKDTSASYPVVLYTQSQVVLAHGSTVEVWDVETMTRLRSFEVDRARVSDFDLRGRLCVGVEQSLVTVPDEGRRESRWTVHVWDVATATKLHSFLEPKTKRVPSVRLTPDGARIVVCLADNMISVREIATGEVICSFKHDGEQNLPVMGFDAEGHYLAIASFGPAAGRLAVTVWNIQTGGQVCRLEHESRDVMSLAFSPDSKLLATTGQGATAKVWSVATGALLREFRGHSGLIVGVAFNEDGRSLATASLDGTLKTWQVDPPNDSFPVDVATGMAFSLDGRLLALRNKALIYGTSRITRSSGTWKLANLSTGLQSTRRAAM